MASRARHGVPSSCLQSPLAVLAVDCASDHQIVPNAPRELGMADPAFSIAPLPPLAAHSIHEWLRFLVASRTKPRQGREPSILRPKQHPMRYAAASQLTREAFVQRVDTAELAALAPLGGVGGYEEGNVLLMELERFPSHAPLVLPKLESLDTGPP